MSLAIRQLVRRYSTNPPPTPRKQNNTLLYAALGLAAAGGAYYYYNQPQAAASHTQQQQPAASQGAVQSVETAARQTSADAQAQYDTYKTSAQRVASSARDTAESIYKDARQTAEDNANQLRQETKKIEQEAKAGWFSWLSWGRSRRDDAKKDAASKVAGGAGEIKDQAEKHN